MTEPVAIAAVDLGATSGRVMLARVTPTSIELEQVARFPNGPVRTPDGLHWNVLGLYEHVLAGLREAARRAPVRSIGIDSWAVDYALLREGRMLGEPFHYRDDRTAAGVETVHAIVPADELYRANGLQHLPFNTVFQLAAERLDDVDAALLVPDLLAYWLTGRQVAERTNASTTGLLDPATGTWNAGLLARLGLPSRILPPLVDPGETIGALLPHVADELGSNAHVIAVGSHDTASAVVAVPATSPDFAYISCGTWGLVGVELDAPVLTDAGRAANFTNEGGVDGTVRYLHNVMGLWLLTESVREWERDGSVVDLPVLLAEAAVYDGPVALFDANDPGFLAPGSMATRIAEHCRDRGLPLPDSRAGWARSIVESLAAAFADAVRTASELSGRRVDTIHLVGGGSQNELLCRLTAERSGLPVVAGPVEATAIGNVLVQARALGVIEGGLEALRSVVAASVQTRRFEP
ncbi:rhamnulokinase [Diaminobutyricimonas aerilata]|uniref:Rhamnulokinase n=1 Tax=Diaminobutyricimonas aerilata TaxID=1162967 RepID=A0A2M9CFN7_9MICO|nr:rhamnulokinase family protein [Diaminobutyricimonas aerilata]PJJ70662.1 rhamnulokinase [Diaminobutyricimonas aerilata]